ncbi:MAG: efflux RND transporter periplasmic adaptor subunit [bacterium]|nr:MAG: efflux RND transporter periplasmic adaptor subunit [bacterium]
MKKILIIAAIVIVLAVIVIANLTSGEDAVEVQTEKVFVADITEKVTGNGKIYPVVDVDISAKVSGEIFEINANEGDTVKTGQVLVVLDGEQYKALRDRAQSQISGAQAELRLSKSELNRAHELFQKQLISQAELEIAQSKYELAESRLQQAEASLKEAEDALDKTVLRAPMKGVIIRKNKDAGEMALGSQFQADVVLGLADLSRMEARVEVNENDIINVSLSDSCEVEIDAFQDTTFLGVVSEISHSAKTKATGTIEEVTNYEVKILLVDKLPSFRPGMSATADIRTRTEKNVLNVPIQSLTARDREKLEKKTGVEKTPAERESENPDVSEKKKVKKEDDLVEVVFVVEEGVAKMREVDIGISDENYYEVKSGLSEGEEVVTGPFRVLSRTLKDEDKVKIKNQEKEFSLAK